MDTHHTGFNYLAKGAEADCKGAAGERGELISIRNGALAMTITGKAGSWESRERDDGFSNSSLVKCQLRDEGVHVFICGKEVEGTEDKDGIFKWETMPLFFEQQNYTIEIEYEKQNPQDKVTFWHENSNIRQQITETGKLRQERLVRLLGTINFRNDIGVSSLFVRVNGRVAVKLDIEVFPTKIDYKKDYERMLWEVTDEVYSLAFDFMKKTFRNVGIGMYKGGGDNEFLAVMREIFGRMMKAVDLIGVRPHYELVKRRQMVPAYKVKRTDTGTIRWMSRHPQAAKKTAEGRVGFEQYPVWCKQVTKDTFENQFVVYVLEQVLKRLEKIRTIYDNESYSRAKDRDFTEELDTMAKEIRKVLRFSFLKEVSGLKEVPHFSLVLGMARGYRELYRYYLIFDQGLAVDGELFHISIKDTALLYEYWCFIKLNRILGNLKDEEGRLMYRAIGQNLLKVDKHGLTVVLKKGSCSQIRYRNVKSGKIMELTYNPRIDHLPTLTQRPDFLLSVYETGKKGAEPEAEYVFDAKYRVNMADEGTEYRQNYKTPGPQTDTINTMHRYRDAIVGEVKGENGGKDNLKKYRQRIAGAYVLFPYENEEEYKNHRFYQSIADVQIGGLPFLPGTWGLVEKVIRECADGEFGK